MNKLSKNFLSIALAVLMIFSCTAPVMATVDETQTPTEETSSVQVVYEQASSYSVTIPKKITLDSDKTSSYTVTVSGDLGSDEVVTVVPEESFEMSDQATVDNKKPNITATVTQDKTEWTFDNISIAGNGKVSAPDLTAGSWAGTFYFNISLDSNSTVVEHSGLIPEGATYTLKATSEVLEAGDEFPETVAEGDLYTYDDFIYGYFPSYSNGWMVAINTDVTDKNQATYGEILKSIGGQPVTDMSQTFNACTYLTISPKIPDSITNMHGTFSGCISLTEAPAIPSNVTKMYGTFGNCTNLTEAPEIPSSVTNMGETFTGCISLTEAPVIPNNVTNMYNTFRDCTSLTIAPIIPNSVTDMTQTFINCTNLTEAPEIPSSVTEMSGTFYGCTNLSGTIKINANPEQYIYCFNNVDMSNITLTGASTMLDDIGATGNNYCADCNGKCLGTH